MTSTELATVEERPAEVALNPTGHVATLAQWAGEARAAHALAQSLCNTSFVPKHFQGKPAEATAAILTGFELGLSPMASLRAIFVIGGTPGMYAKVMVAVVLAQGHEVWVEEQSDERVVVCGKRKNSDHIARTVWDTDRARKAKLLSNAKYVDSPQQMFTARGQAEICRQIAPDALHGIPYAVEEIEDFAPEIPATPRVTAAEITAEDEFADLVEDEPADTPEVTA